MKIDDGFANPLDRPDWRWGRVQQLVKDGLQPNKGEDRFIWKGWHFLSKYEATENRSQVFELCNKNKDMAKAVGWNKEPGQRRFLVEALLLCRDLNEEEIATYLLENEAAIILYGKLFFDVAEHKDDPGYVAKQVFKPALMRKLHDTTDPDLGWKLAAMFGGFELVRTYWEVAMMPDSMQDLCELTGVALLKRNFCLGNFARPVNKFSVDKVSDQLMRYLEVQVKKEMADGMNANSGMDDKLTLMAEVVESIQFSMVNPDDKIPEKRQPRFHERLQSNLKMLPNPNGG